MCLPTSHPPDTPVLSVYLFTVMRSIGLAFALLLFCCRRKISQRLPGLEALREKKSVVSYEDILTINGTKYSTFQEVVIAEGLSESADFVNEVSGDVASVLNLTEEEPQVRIL
ncbi:hypothetical protein TNCV_1405041 [Trichonephila clavipes]|nr:hypothetical protein TNCV_1405041 [Trichonephila clavipes]